MIDLCVFYKLTFEKKLKVFMAVLLLLILPLFSGCSKTNSVPSNYQIESKSLDVYDNENIKIEYPQLSSEVCDFSSVNSFIQEQLKDELELHFDYFHDFTFLNIDYTVLYSDSTYISVLFEGSFENQSVNASIIKFSMNINIECRSRVYLNDYVDIDDNFVRNVKKDLKEKLPAEISEYLVGLYTDEQLKEILRESENSFFCFTKDKFFIYFDVPAAAGYYVYVEHDQNVLDSIM